MVRYPAELPTDAILSVIAAIKSGSITTNIAPVAEDLWNLVGYALKSTFGETLPPGAVSSVFGAPMPSNEQILHDLELLVNQARTTGHAFMALPIPWITILKWGLTLLLQSL